MDPASIIRRSAQMYADNVAVWFEGREQTYAQLYARACRLANAIQSFGAKSGDRVAVLSDNAFETVEIAAACALANCPRATLYTYHAASVNRYLLDLVEARILVIQAKYFEELSPLLKDLPALRSVIIFGGEPSAGGIGYESTLAAASAKDPMIAVKGNDVHIIRFSSGTTGKPKGIFHSVDRWSNYNSEWRWSTPMLSERSRYLVPTSLAHLGVAFLWGILMVGGRIVPMPAFDAKRTLELLESQAITHAVAVPVMIREMVKEPEARTRDLSKLQCLMYAGSPIAAGTLRDAIQVFSSSLFQLYAQSEAMPITMLLPHQHLVDGTEAELRRLRSVGRPSANVQVTIRGSDGEVLASGEIGEIAARGPGTMSGIWNDPEGTAARTLPDGSVLTRDMGYIDADGFVYLVDRKDDMIVSGGYNIWPSELEEALATHPDVAEVCVFGIPDDKWGETPKAVVALRKDATVSIDDLIAHTRNIVGSIKKVTSIEITTALPRTATGKVLRSSLKERYWTGHVNRVSGS